MSELRHDPLTGRSTLVVPRRQWRPRDQSSDSRPARPAGLPAYDADCPFCPGAAPDRVPILTMPDLEGGWRARIVENSFPALASQPRSPGHPAGLAAQGRHEVIIESPRHDRDLADMSPPEFRAVIQLQLARLRQLARDSQAAQLFLFRNRGARAGSSLVHPHSQLMALPFVPAETMRREAHLARIHAESGANPFAAALAQERAEGRRVVAANADHVAYVPFAPEVSLELRVQPIRPSRDPFDLDPPQIATLAELLLDSLVRLGRYGGDPAYNLLWTTMSRANRSAPFAGWYVRIVPRMVAGGGFELASGVAIVAATPEADAARLRGELIG